MKGTGYNRVLPKAGRNCFDWAFVQGSTFVLQLKFGAKNPAFGNTQTVISNPALVGVGNVGGPFLGR